MILMQGRMKNEDAQIMAHEVSSGNRGKVHDMRVSFEHSVKLNENNLKILGVVEYDETLEMNGVKKTSKIVNKAINDTLLRLNLPIME